MKFLFDLLPIVLFFVVFKAGEANPGAAAAFATEHVGLLVRGGLVGPQEAPVLLATLVVITATLAQISVLLAMRRKVDTMLWVSLVLVTVLGGATVWLHSETFIKWKPSILYWVMGTALWLSQAVFGKNLLQSLMGAQLTLPPPAWRTLNLMWIAFFTFMGLLNLYVAYAYPTDTWVNFKLFGGVGLMLVFTLAQGYYVSRQPKAEDE